MYPASEGASQKASLLISTSSTFPWLLLDYHKDKALGRRLGGLRQMLWARDFGYYLTFERILPLAIEPHLPGLRKVIIQLKGAFPTGR
jgi:hypothetical protein